MVAGGWVLEGLYGVIGCRCVDVVRLVPGVRGVDMWLDDEGMFCGVVNGPATGLARVFGFRWQPYFGTVVVTGGADEAGDTVGLGDGDLALVRELLATADAVGA